MRYTVIASDYDGTLAIRGKLPEPTVPALRRWRAHGGKLILITGRFLDSFPTPEHFDLFDVVVGENGAVLFVPATGEQRTLGAAPPAALVTLLRERGVEPLFVGESMIATYQPHEIPIQAALQELGLDWRIIMNKWNVMVLPAGVDKASGLHAALAILGHPLDATVGVGDAENDEDFLAICGHAVAVDNALPALKQQAHRVTQGEHGYGVAELVEALLAEAG